MTTAVNALLDEAQCETANESAEFVPGPNEWPSPSPLEGVKSRRRCIFQLSCAETFSAGRTVKLRNLSLSLSSRVIAVGVASPAAVDLLLDIGNYTVQRHEDLKILHLGPSTLRTEGEATSYACAIASALIRDKPHVVVLDGSGILHDAEWQDAFNRLVHEPDMWNFPGAILVCAAEETDVLQRRCSERWIFELGEIRQRPCFKISENVMSEGLDILQTDAARIAQIGKCTGYAACDLNYWIDKACANDWTVTRFDAGGVDGTPSLRGLVFHHMIEGSAEFHVRFIFVPKEHRRAGIGGQLVRWVIGLAARMPQSDCKWISLEAADDELVPFYEKFGFFDMSCGRCDGDDGQTHMEMPNVSVECSS